MFSRITCIFLFITACPCLTGCSGSNSREVEQAEYLYNANDADLVQIVLSCPFNVGPLGVIAGRSHDEKTRETALNELLARHPDWNWELIQQKGITVGMTEHELRLAWGNPYKIYRSHYGERWVVFVRLPRNVAEKNIFVENGNVTAWN